MHERTVPEVESEEEDGAEKVIDIHIELEASGQAHEPLDVIMNHFDVKKRSQLQR